MLGIVAAPSLAMVGFLVAALVGLSCLPDEAGRHPSPGRVATLATGALSLLFTAPQWLQALGMIPGFGFRFYGAVRPLTSALGRLSWLTGGYLALILLAAFATSLTLWIASLRRDQQR